MRQYLYIFLGGGIGSILRFALAGFCQKLWGGAGFPMGTFVVNVVGCFLIGLFSACFIKEEGMLRFLLITGFCGGFTTFSTFSAENFSMLQQGNFLGVALNIFLSVGFGLAAVFAAFQLLKP